MQTGGGTGLKSQTQSCCALCITCYNDYNHIRPVRATCLCNWMSIRGQTGRLSKDHYDLQAFEQQLGSALLEFSLNR